MSIRLASVSFLAALMVVINVGCSGAVASNFSRANCRDYDVAKTFFEGTYKERVYLFRAFDIETQYNLLICGNQAIHPPMFLLADEFAKNGDRGARFLKEKLLVERDGATIRDIIRVFREMSRHGIYMAKTDSGMVAALVDAVNRINDPDWKEISSQMLDEILSPHRAE